MLYRHSNQLFIRFCYDSLHILHFIKTHCAELCATFGSKILGLSLSLSTTWILANADRQFTANTYSSHTLNISQFAMCNFGFPHYEQRKIYIPTLHDGAHFSVGGTPSYLLTAFVYFGIA